jgi:pimeloyl-ACP methyl ester carboxylesterase
MCAGYQGTLPRLPELYQTIVASSLILWAGRDKHFPLAHAERLHAAIPGSQLDVIADAEHWMPWSCADLVSTRLGSFLNCT